MVDERFGVPEIQYLSNSLSIRQRVSSALLDADDRMADSSDQAFGHFPPLPPVHGWSDPEQLAIAMA